MIEVTEVQLQTWLAMYFWPFVRLGACFMAAPIFGARFVPVRLRIALAAILAVLVAPLLPAPPDVHMLSIEGVVITLQQVLIGVSLGFMMQLIFDAIGLGGQLLANSMGLSFAFNIDPARGAATPALGQLYLLLITMTFVSLGGHVALIELMVRGLTVLPIGSGGLGTAGLWSVVGSATHLFEGALIVALPGVTALLVANLAFGVMSRAAPTLNLFAVGFPITLVFGLVMITVGLPGVQSTFIALTTQTFQALMDLQMAPGR